MPLSESSRFARFLLSGGIAAAGNVAVRWLLSFAMAYEAAVALAYLAGMAIAFLLARLFVFDHDGGAARGQLVRFGLVNAVAFAQVWLVSVWLARLVFPAIGFAWEAETVAHAIGVASPVATSYFLHKHFSFRDAGVRSGR
jgi:putative flippase GtrA